MTDFRPEYSLRAYSGGPVRDSHTILYSLPYAGIRAWKHSNYSIAYYYILFAGIVNRFLIPKMHNQFPAWNVASRNGRVVPFNLRTKRRDMPS